MQRVFCGFVRAILFLSSFLSFIITLFLYWGFISCILNMVQCRCTWRLIWLPLSMCLLMSTSFIFLGKFGLPIHSFLSQVSGSYADDVRLLLETRVQHNAIHNYIDATLAYLYFYIIFMTIPHIRFLFHICHSSIISFAVKH